MNLSYRRGAKAYRDGGPMPDRPADDASLEDSAFWLGYMVTRGLILIEQWRVEDALRPDPNEPRPRKAA